MKKTLFVALATLLSCAAATAPVRKDACLACHGSYEKLAKRTEKVTPQSALQPLRRPRLQHLPQGPREECHHVPSVPQV